MYNLWIVFYSENWKIKKNEIRYQNMEHLINIYFFCSGFKSNFFLQI